MPTQAQVIGLIEQSNILLDKEKTYWKATLPRMNPAQVDKLMRILQKAQKIPWNEAVNKYFKSVTGSAKQTIAT